MTLPNVLMPTYVKMLGALSAWLDKADAQRPGGKAEALLSARLAPDMYPPSTEIRFACVHAQEGVSRLFGQAIPASAEILLNERRDAEQRPGSIADARARLAQTVAFVEAASAKAAKVDPASPVAHALPHGPVFDFTAEQYARDWALSQFYFHIVSAYAILRAQSVDLGKADYVARLLPYLRPETVPP